MSKRLFSYVKTMFAVLLATIFTLLALTVAFAIPVPTDVRVIMTQAGDNALTVAWSYSGPPQPEAYWIIRNGKIFKYNSTATGSVMWSDTGLDSGVNYMYRVAVSTAGGLSQWSLKAAGRTKLTGSHTMPHAAFTDNSNMCHACHSVHMAPTPFKVLQQRYSEQRADYTGIQPGVTLCFNCHDGTGAENDIKTKYENTGAFASAGHRIKTTASYSIGWKGSVTYAVGQQQPCMTCHDAHLSSLGNYKMLADDLYRYARTTNSNNRWLSTGGWITSTSYPWKTSVSDSVGSNSYEKCTVCHHGTPNTDGTGGKTDQYMIIRGIDLYWMPSPQGSDCLSCHNDPHELSPGAGGYPTTPQPACNCHMSDPSFANMQNDDNTSLHLITSSPGTDANNPNPGSCEFRCHNNHGQRNPTRAFNVWLDSQNRSAGSADYDYSAGYSSGGLCLSCHGRSVQTTARTGGTSNSTPYVSRIYSQAADGYPGFINTSHNYFTDGFRVGGWSEGQFSFRGNCIKCHRSSNQNPGTDKGSKYGPHASANRSLLVYPTDAEGSGGGKYEGLCFKCHYQYKGATAYLRPNTTGSYNSWGTLVGGSVGWEVVDEETSDGDTSYIASATGASRTTQSFNIEGSSKLGPSSVIISTVSISATLNRDGAGVAVALAVWNGVSVSIGSNVSPLAGWSAFTRNMPTSPFTGSAWTASELDNLEIGVIETDADTNFARCTQIYAEVKYDSAGEYWANRQLPTVAWKIEQAFDERPTWGHAWYLTSTSIDRHRAWGSEGTQPFWMDQNNRHVECVDCHNPHYVSQSYNYWASLPYTGSVNELETPNWRGASEKLLSKPLRGVWGVYPTTNWNAIPTAAWSHLNPAASNYPDKHNATTPVGRLFRTEAASKQAYICFKCHSSYAYGTTGTERPVIPSGIPSVTYAGTPEATLRIGRQTDILAEFNPNNYGYHPVLSVGKNQPPMNANPDWLDAGTNSGYRRNIAAYGDSNPPGLTTAFVPPFGASSLITCSDCHSHNSASYSRGYYTGASSVVNSMDFPRGPHGSTNRWLLRGLDTSIRYQLNNGSWYNYAGTVISSEKYLCLNCHRADVYGYQDNDPEGDPNAKMSRIPHFPDASANVADGTMNVFGVACRSCHGGRTAGGIHGSSIGKEDGGDSYSGKRLLNGAVWRGVSRGTAGNPVLCWLASSSDSLQNCNRGEVGGSGNNYNYTYDAGPDP